MQVAEAVRSCGFFRFREGSAGSVEPGTRQRGAVTAEFVIALPAAILVLSLCLGAISGLVQQMRLTDVAANLSRALARGDPPEAARNRLAALVPGAGITIDRDGELICVKVERRLGAGPVNLPLMLSARGCSLGPEP